MSTTTDQPSFLSSLVSTSYSLPLRIYRHLSSSTTPLSSPTTNASTTTTTIRGFTAPSPLTYLTSSYLLISLSLAFLLHRIHHLVPPSNPLNQQQQQRINTPYVQWGIRLPGLIAMGKSIVELTISLSSTRTRSILLTTSWIRSGLKGLVFMNTFCGGKGELGRYLEQTSSTSSELVSSSSSLTTSHPSLLFSTFLSISLSILLETLVRSLSSDSPQLHSFNLLSFSFLLHVQSQPSSSSTSTSTRLGGENTQLYIYLLLTLLELSTLQLSYLIPFSPVRSRTHSNTAYRRTTKHHRFKITLLYSLISQFFALRSFYSIYSLLNENEGGGEGSGNGNRLGDSFIWFNKLPELFFQLIVVSSIGLKAFAGFIRGDPLTRESLVGPHFFGRVDWDSSEDYTIVLIKYTTLLLRSTRISTLSYELSPMNLLPNLITSSLSDPTPSSSASNSTSTRDDQGGLRVRLERNGDLLLIEELEQSTEGGGGGLRRRKGRGRGGDVSEAVEYGFGTEIRQVLVEPFTGERERESSGIWEGEWGDGFQSQIQGAGFEFGPTVQDEGEGEGGEIGLRFIQGGNERRNWILRFLGVLGRILIYVGWVGVTSLRRLVRKGLRIVGLRSDRGIIEDTWTIRERAEEDQQESEDDDDEEYAPSTQSEEESESEESDDSGGGEMESLQRLRVARELRFSRPQDQPQEEEEEVEENPLALISDLSQSLAQDQEDSSCSPSQLAPYLIAHHLSSSSSTSNPSSNQPLTRKRYQSLLSLQPSHSHSHEQDFDSNSSLSVLESAIHSHQSQLLEESPPSPSTSSGALKRKSIPLTEEERERKRQVYRDSLSSFCCVCTVEPRTIILWPCRCLCLCESCREALAERTLSTNAGGGGIGNVGDGGNLCPTCRTGIAGYSRIV